MIVLFADVLAGLGGIESYLDALARTLHAEGRPFRVAVSPNGPAPFLDELEKLGIDVYRQPRVVGDSWCIRQRLLVHHVASRVAPGDWVYCVRQPMPMVYLPLVRAVHRKKARVAASWIFTPEFLPPPTGRVGERFRKAVSETDAVISVSYCGVPGYREMYGYEGEVKVVRYHNRSLFDAVVPMPAGHPFSIGYMGRIDIHQKNLDTILGAFGALHRQRQDVVLNVYGGGPDEHRFADLVRASGLGDAVRIHGRYRHDRDLLKIVGENHFFLYTSRFEGGPCFSLLELMQAGRYVVASPVGGIPDIYERHPDAGALVSSLTTGSLADAMADAIEKVCRLEINTERIRSIYLSEFSNVRAHSQFLRALGIN